MWNNFRKNVCHPICENCRRKSGIQHVSQHATKNVASNLWKQTCLSRNQNNVSNMFQTSVNTVSTTLHKSIKSSNNKTRLRNRSIRKLPILGACVSLLYIQYMKTKNKLDIKMWKQSRKQSLTSNMWTNKSKQHLTSNMWNRIQNTKLRYNTWKLIQRCLKYFQAKHHPETVSKECLHMFEKHLK